MDNMLLVLRLFNNRILWKVLRKGYYITLKQRV